MATGDEILAWKKEKQVPEKRIECPICAWTLQEHPTKGLHCPFCGWVYDIGRNNKSRR